MDELEKFCENCKRCVSSLNFASHSAYCARNVKVCSLCDEPHPISLEEDHLKSHHAVEPCNLCDQPVEKWLLPKHQDVCVKRLIQCEFCDLKLPYEKYPEHEDFCGSRTEKCLLCQKYVMLKEKQNHTEGHRLGKKMLEDKAETQSDGPSVMKASSELGACKLEASEKSYAFQSIAQYDPEEEQNRMNEARSMSNSASKLLKASLNETFSNATGNEDTRDVGRTACNDSSKKENSKYLTTCHVCKQTVRWIDYNTHVPTCATDHGKCSRCGESVASGTMKLHLKKCLKNPPIAALKEYQERIEKVSSELSVTGSDEMHEYRMQEHKKSFQKSKTAQYSNYFEGSASNATRRHNESKGALPKNSAISKMMTPTVGRCKYCKTFLNDDILSIHEEQCIHQEIKCPECSDSFKLKDVDYHVCKYSKAKGKQNKKSAKSKVSDSSSMNWRERFFNIGSNFFQDKYENDSNANLYPQIQDVRSAYQHFPQMDIDDTKIPCEFCGQLLSVNDLIVHETGCNPEVSLPKRQLKAAENVKERKAAENVKERKAAAPQRIEQEDPSGGSYFFYTGKPPTSKNTSYKRQQESTVKPGEFLNGLKLSPELEGEKGECQLMDVKPSAIASVWNFDSSVDDGEMFEKISEKTLASDPPKENLPTVLDGKASDDSRELSSGSDDELSKMLDFIHDKKTRQCEATVEKEGKLSNSEHDSSSGLNGSLKQDIEESSLPHGAAAGTQSKEMPFKEAFQYILKSYPVQETACQNPTSISDGEEKENFKVCLNDNLKVQESGGVA